MAAKSEATIVREIIAWIKANNGDAFKLHGSAVQRVGEPDICGEIMYEGSIYHIKCEVKTPTGVLSSIQERRLQDYARFGYFVCVSTSVEQFIAQLREHHYGVVETSMAAPDRHGGSR